MEGFTMSNQTNLIVPILYTYNEAAKIYKMSPLTLRRWVSQKKISCVKLGGSVRFTPEILNNFIKGKNT